MCGRFVIFSKNPFGIKYKSSFNIAPSNMVPVKIRQGSFLIKWNYVPYWKKDIRIINCRSETMFEKSSFKNAKKCVIFHDGWYEWKKIKVGKVPYYHHCKSNFFAGLYNETGCLILTRNATEGIKHIHHRQPVLLEKEEVSLFLGGENIFDSKANYNINFYRVGNDVNKPINNNPKLIYKLKEE